MVTIQLLVPFSSKFSNRATHHKHKTNLAFMPLLLVFLLLVFVIL